MTNEPMTWVLAWRPFNPKSMFVYSVSDDPKALNSIQAMHGVRNAKRMTRGEAEYLLQILKASQGNEYTSELVVVNLADHGII